MTQELKSKMSETEWRKYKSDARGRVLLGAGTGAVLFLLTSYTAFCEWATWTTFTQHWYVLLFVTFGNLLLTCLIVILWLTFVEIVNKCRE